MTNFMPCNNSLFIALQLYMFLLYALKKVKTMFTVNIKETRGIACRSIND
jgi:hypothetical protein